MKLKKFLSISLITSMIISVFTMPTFADKKNTSIEESDPISISLPKEFKNDRTIKEIYDIFNEYLNENNIDLKFGTDEYLNYVYDQMLYNSDKKLSKHNEYNEILAYFAEYIGAYEDYTFSGENGEFSINNIESKDKTLSELRYENIKEEQLINDSSNSEKKIIRI